MSSSVHCRHLINHSARWAASGEVNVLHVVSDTHDKFRAADRWLSIYSFRRDRYPCYRVNGEPIIWRVEFERR